MSKGSILLDGSKITFLRRRLGWSQARLAEMAGVAKRTIERVEKGYPTYLHTALQISSALDTDLNELQGVELTILMPCLNEESTIPACVREAMQALDAAEIVGEVLVVDSRWRETQINRKFGAPELVISIAR